MKTIKDLGEFGLIDRISRFAAPAADVLAGIGDDCAVLRLGDRKLLISTDTAVENIHFRRDLATPHDIGYKCAASSLSDIAAMGGTPLYCLVSLSCPETTELAFVDGLYQGISNLISVHGVILIGGDTTRAHEYITIDVQVIGEAKGAQAVRRKGAKAGDYLVITNTLGMSAAGLIASLHRHDVPALLAAHYRPTPRIMEGKWLASQPSVHAMIDISDGLVQDAGHLAKANRLGVNIVTSDLQPDPQLAKYCWENRLDAMELMLAGGEDYELAFAVAEGEYDLLCTQFRQEIRTPLQRIGQFTLDWTGVRVDGRPTTLRGFEHFTGTIDVESSTE